MRRLRRMVVYVLIALSLAAALFVAGLWVRSYWRFDATAIGVARGRQIAAESVQGTLGFSWITDPSYLELRVVFFSADAALFAPHGLTGIVKQRVLGFGVRREQYRPVGQQTVTRRTVALPHWFALAVSLAPATLRWIAWRRRRRFGHEGRCLACGYDLRATPDRCPECGTAAVAPPAVSPRG